MSPPESLIDGSLHCSTWSYNEKQKYSALYVYLLSLPIVALANSKMSCISNACPLRLLLRYLHHLSSTYLNFYFIYNQSGNLHHRLSSIRSLNYSVTFSLIYWAFQEIEMQKMIGTRCESRDLYHLKTGVGLVVCLSSTSLQYFQYRCGHPIVQVLNKLVSKLGQISLLNMSHVKWVNTIMCLIHWESIRK